MPSRTLCITGMTCDHCAPSAAAELNTLAGVSATVLCNEEPAWVTTGDDVKWNSCSMPLFPIAV